MGKKTQARTKPQACTAEHVREKTKQPGWLLPHVQMIDTLLSGRWEWWINRLLEGELDDHQIPQVPFQPFPSRINQTPYPVSGDIRREIGSGPEILKQFMSVLDHVRSIKGWSVNEVLRWFIYALDPDKNTIRPSGFDDETEIILYQDAVQSLVRMMGIPGDWAADIMFEVYGQGNSHTGWFPTPGSLCKLMGEMTFGMDENIDTRAHSAHDPCLGTGVTMLYASNYCLDLSGQDIDPTMVAWARIQMYLFAPWGIYGDKNRIKEIQLHRAIKSQSKVHKQNGVKRPPTRKPPRKIKA